MDQSKSQDQKCHSNRHHAIPRSRIPQNYRGKLLKKWILVGVLTRAHDFFHTIFGNRTTEEQAEHLRKMCDENGILNIQIYVNFKACFDEIFRGRINFNDMAEILKEWDVSEEIKAAHAAELAEIRRVLNNGICGGINIRKFKLN